MPFRRSGVIKEPKAKPLITLLPYTVIITITYLLRTCPLQTLPDTDIQIR